MWGGGVVVARGALRRPDAGAARTCRKRERERERGAGGAERPGGSVADAWEGGGGGARPRCVVWDGAPPEAEAGDACAEEGAA